MLMDILATITAFASAMLLFSLLVTASVQAIHSIFNLRFHNLRMGLETFVEDINNDVFTDNDEAKIKVKEAVEQCTSVKKVKSTVRVSIKPESIDNDELQNTIKQKLSKVLNEEQIKQLEETMVQRFKNAELFMAQRFQKISHGLSIFLGLVIATVYQINTPDLLSKLSVDPALRAAYISQTENLLALETEFLPVPTYATMAGNTIKNLMVTSPQKQELQTLLTTDLSTESSVLSSMKKLFVNNTAAYKQIKTEYQSSIETTLTQTANKHNEQWQAQMSEVSLLNFTIMPNGLEYYTDTSDMYKLVHNYFGVFISTILISLGAPFWFKNLRMMFDLQERLRKKA